MPTYSRSFVLSQNEQDVFKGKNILLVCAETQSWPMHYLAEELRAQSKSISAIFIQPGEAYFSAPDYTMFKELNKDMCVYGMSKVVSEYIEKEGNATKYLDRNYINNIENKYTNFSILNEQFLSEMTLLPYYHDRSYYKFVDYNRILLYVQIYYKYIEDIFLNKKPDMILDCEVDFFGRSVLLEVATAFNVPYISLDHTRINGYVLPTNVLSKRINSHIRSFYQEYLNNPYLEKETNLIKFADEVQKTMGDIPIIFEKDFAKLKFDAYRMLKELVVHSAIFIKNFSFERFVLNRIKGITSPICGDIIGKLVFTYAYYFRRFYLHYFNVFSQVDLKSINYIYVPLHVIPESSTTILSPIYINELFIIESLSKSIKTDQFIVVKEHWSMIGFRPLSFYAKIKRLPNVILIDPKLKKMPKDYIGNADLIVTISGSAALEAAMMGKNSLVFSDVIYSLLSSVKKIHIDINLKNIIKAHTSYVMPIREKLAYFKLIIDHGERVELKHLYLPPHMVSKNNLKNSVHRLISAYRKGLTILLDEKSC
jgi:hypothetical protein